MYVYLLRSKADPKQRYVGLTNDLKNRLSQHNAGNSAHTSKFSPWEIVLAIYFADPAKARVFEHYLKNGPGHAFANRHFW